MTADDGLGWPAAGVSGTELAAVGLGWPTAESDGRTDAGDGAPPVADREEAAPTAAAPAVPEPERSGLAADLPMAATIRESLAVVSRETAAILGEETDVSRETATTTSAPAAVSRETTVAALTAVVPTSADRGTESWPRPNGQRVFSVANQKGGVGKTTSTVNLAAALAQHGEKVLVIDLDPQGNASTAFGVEHRAGTPSIYDVLVDGESLEGVAVPVGDLPGLFCAPATIDLAGAEIELVSVVARESRLSRALNAATDPYDFVFVDCPPSLGLLTVNALVAAREVLIPIQCEFYALEGLSQLLRNIELVRSHLNPGLHVSTILLTMYDGRTRLAEQVAEEVRTHFGELVLGATIPRSVRISEAPGYGQTVMTYDPSSRGALAYTEAARELAERSATDDDQRPAMDEERSAE